MDTIEARLRLVMNTIPDRIWSALPDGTVDFVNERWVEYTGLSIDESIASAVHPEDLATFNELWRSSKASGTPFEKEIRFRRADGE